MTKTLVVFFHLFTLNLPTNPMFIWSNICLLILTISFLNGFMRVVVDEKKKAIDDNKQGFSYGLKNSKSPLQVKDLI